MKTMKWLIKRELWEHKGMLLWAPAIVGGLITAFTALVLLYSGSGSIDINGESITLGMIDATPAMRAKILDVLAHGYIATAAPVLLMLGFLVFFYCLGALYDERRDRSLLFWKSLPVSDRTTVLSKLLLALGVAPLVVTVVGALAALAVLLMICTAAAFKGLNLFGPLLMSPAFYLAPLQLLALLPVYALWALPTVAWLLLVSSWARSKVFLWAVGAPLLAMMLAKWAKHAFHLDWNIDWLIQQVVGRMLLGVAPGSWLAVEHVDPALLLAADGHRADLGNILGQSWGTLAHANVWIGVAAGVAMIAGAIWLRRRREEG